MSGKHTTSAPEPTDRWTFSRRTLGHLLAASSATLAFGARAEAMTGPGTERLPLNHWRFAPVDATGAALTPESTVDLPHVGADLSWHQWEPGAWEHRMRYRTRFSAVPTPGRRHHLSFHGALTTTAPVLNGHRLPVHHGGYLPFSHEVTTLLRRNNELEVVVDGRLDPDTPPNHGPGSPSSSVDFWQPAGLHRGVELISVPADHLVDIFARPRAVLDPRQRSLEVHCGLAIDTPDSGLVLHAELRDDDTVLAAEERDLADLPPGRNTATVHLPGLTDIALWSTATPQLYEVVVALKRGSTEVHQQRVRTGFREARFTERGFFLNDSRIQLRGLNRHQFYPYLGAAAPARVQRRDAEILRHELNCTMVRCSHYPQHESFLDACDEHGLLVWEEPPGWQHLGGELWRQRCLRDLRAMILRDRNHPSIVLWAARLNETPDDLDFHAHTEKLAKSLDDSRQTTGAILGADHDTAHFQHDVFGYNDYSAAPAPNGTLQPELAPPRAGFPYLVSEAVGTLSGPARFYRRTDPQSVRQAQALAHARVHDAAGRDERYCGVLAWAGFDYPSGNGNVHQSVKWPGVIDLFRVPKAGAAMYRAQCDPYHRPVIEPSFCWDFHPFSPVTDLGARAAIWSNLTRLDIVVDGQHLASVFPAHEEFPGLEHPPFFADFSAVDGRDHPELRVDGYLDTDLVLRREFCSDRDRDVLALSVDHAALVAGGTDLTRAQIGAVDRYGNERTYLTGAVEFDLNGPAILIGDNPFPLEATGGAGAVWLRSARSGHGPVRLHARHPTLGSAYAELTVSTIQRSTNA